jgi:hypothetical protein
MTPRSRARTGLVLAAVGGLGAAALYVGTVVLGGAIVPGYSHVTDSVSELTSPGAPYGGLLAWGFAGYNLAVILLAVGVRLASGTHRAVSAAVILLIACGLAGLLMIQPFPQDPMGSPVTPQGVVHIVLAGVSAVTLVVAAVLLGIGWRRDARFGRLSIPSFVAAAAILVTGGVGAALVTSPVFGLLERSTQFSFLAWFAAIGVTAAGRYRREP